LLAALPSPWFVSLLFNKNKNIFKYFLNYHIFEMLYFVEIIIANCFKQFTGDLN